jgi:addiction module HigA family antidote
LEEYLNAKQMSQVDLAKRIGLTTKTINEIIKGKAPITAQTSLKLELVFGAPASFWNNLEAQYQETKARIEEEQRIKAEEDITSYIPYTELAKLGLVPKTRQKHEKVIHLRSFFGIASLEFIPELHPVAFRAEKEKAIAYATSPNRSTAPAHPRPRGYLSRGMPTWSLRRGWRSICWRSRGFRDNRKGQYAVKSAGKQPVLLNVH